MDRTGSDHGLPFEQSLTPVTITLVYVLVGSAWIAFSDRLLSVLVEGGPLRDVIATGKGWLFVAASGGLLYVLIARREGELRRTNERLDRALQQSSILHRVLRHNLRNTCNLIQGRMETMSDRGDDETLDAIMHRTDKLVGFSEKSRHLKDLLMDESAATSRVDLPTLVERQVDRAREAHPAARFEVELPERAWALTHARFGIVLEELIENAIEHNDSDVPTVWISVTQTTDGRIRLDVGDDGPGIPEMERDILEAGLEKPLFHSEGLGLWLVRVFVTQSGGEVQIVDNDPTGTVVRITLPAASPPESGASVARAHVTAR